MPVGLLLLLSVRALLRPARWWSAVLIWSLFTSLLNHAWLVGTGGYQLIANVLFWMIFLPNGAVSGAARGNFVGDVREVLGAAAFWIIRLQLLLAYGVTGIQKLTGYQWTHGHAIGIVSTDPDYGPVSAGQVALLTMLTYAVLVFQLVFPIAVWWRQTRSIWMWSGVVFHLATGLAFGILDMGLAFRHLSDLVERCDGDQGVAASASDRDPARELVRYLRTACVTLISGHRASSCITMVYCAVRVTRSNWA